MLHANLSRAQLIEESLRRGETQLSADGALVAFSGKFTGRATKDRFIVRDAITESTVGWGKANVGISAAHFKTLKGRVLEVLNSKDSFQMDLSVGADPRYAMPITVQTEYAYQALFAETMFRGPVKGGNSPLKPFKVYAAPSALANPATDGTNSEAFIAINFTDREIIVGGTKYCGEIKKSVFSVMNYELPQLGVMSMHAAANLNDKNESAIFFGLSGTGKTTLSSDASRRLIGDDEHGWGADGVFNIEGGCYAKTIKLSAKAEPEIWAAAHNFGTILENVALDPKLRTIDFDSAKFTENTRAAYPIEQVPNNEPSGRGGHPNALVMLACDAYGVLPPVAKLSTEQAMFYFLSGYTAKVAGTEAGVTEPTATFSACFGEPFMVLHPMAYAKLLAEHLNKQKTPCYLINTGWWKGPYGKGERMPIAISRALVNAAVSGKLAGAPMETDSLFGFQVPTEVPGVPREALRMENTWTDKNAYRDAAKRLAAMFIDNFKRYDGQADPALRMAGPRL